MRRNRLFCLALLTFGLASVTPARAADEIDEEQVATYAVQSRLFRLGGELDVAAGFLPVNAFNKGLSIGGSFTYHINNAVAWEIIKGAYIYKQLDTGLKTELLENFGVEPTDIAALDLLLSTSAVFKPFYGKLAVFNRRVIHVEVSVPVGLSLGRYTNPQTYLFGPNIGAIVRVFLSPRTSLTIDVRDNVLVNHWNDLWKHPSNLSTRNEVHLQLGLAFAWGGDER